MQVRVESMVGREAELGRLRSLLAGASEGCSGVLCLHGPPGQGKTALLERLCDEASDGFAIVRATGVEGESEVPFATLDTVVRPLIEHLDEVPEAQRTALEAALALSSGGTAEPFAVYAGTLSLLAAAAEAKPLLVIVDDLHWVDDASRRALLFAARRLEREAIAVVLATRTADAPDLRGIDVLAVEPLGAEECRRILADVSAGQLPDETATQLVGACAGNPLTLLELAERLTPDELAGREMLIGPPPPNADATALLAERIAALPEDAGRALLVVTTSEDADLEQLRSALSHAGSALDALLPAEEAGLLELRAGRLVLRHPLVRSVAYHAAEPEARRRAHAAVAESLPATDPRRPWHLAAAATAPDEEVAAALEAEAERVRLRGGYRSSGRTWARAADMTPDPARRAERLLQASREFEFGGHFEEAMRVVEGALAVSDDPVVRAKVRGIEASIALRRGRPRDAREGLLEQARALRSDAPGAAARFYLQSAFASMTLGDGDAWEEYAREGFDAAPDDEASTQWVAEAMLASALVGNGKVEEAEPHIATVSSRILDRAEDAPVGGAVEVYALLARTLLWVERWEDADRLLTRLERDARRLNVVGGLPYVLNMRAAHDAHVGRWTTAAAAAAEQVALAHDSGDELFFRVGQATVGWIASMRGRRDECLEAANAAIEGAGDVNVSVGVWARNALGLLALGRGEIEAAVGHLKWVTDLPNFAQPGSRIWTSDLIEALIRAGELREASSRLDTWTADAERTQRIYGLASVARLRGLMAPDEEVDDWFVEAMAYHERSPMPWQRARTLFCWGERLRRSGRRSDARRPLREALAEFERLGSDDWASRSRTELRATGGMVPQKQREDLEELTPHEVKVAMLVAEGRTNREVAAALFLAPKTIEHHLSSIFRKLSIKRRTELARVFASELAEV